MIYDLSREADVIKARVRFDYLVRNKKKVEIIERKAKPRSLSQNALFHAWVKVVADHVGYTDLEDCKRDVKRHLLGTTEETNRLTGEVITCDYRTSRMDSKEMSSFMDRMKAWAATDLGIYLPYFGDPGYEEMINAYGHEKILYRSGLPDRLDRQARKGNN